MGRAWAVDVAHGLARHDPVCRSDHAGPTSLGPGTAVLEPGRAGRPIWPSIPGVDVACHMDVTCPFLLFFSFSFLFSSHSSFLFLSSARVTEKGEKRKKEKKEKKKRRKKIHYRLLPSLR